MSERLGWYRNKLRSMFSQMAAALEGDRKIPLHHISRNRLHDKKVFFFFVAVVFVFSAGYRTRGSLMLSNCVTALRNSEVPSRSCALQRLLSLFPLK